MFSIDFTVQQPPHFTTIPTSAIVNEGDRMAFACAAKSKPAPTIQWLRDDVLIEDDDIIKIEVVERELETESRLMITKACIEHESPKYKVIVENPAGNLSKDFGLIGENGSDI